MLDAIPNIFAAFGLRRLLTSYEGPLVRLRRSSDDAEQDFGAGGDAGWIDTAAVLAWVGDANGHVVTWYDQSGNGLDVTQAMPEAQPVLVTMGDLIIAPNGRPMIYCDGGAYLDRAISTGVTGTAVNSLVCVFRAYSGTGTGSAFSCNNIRCVGALDGEVVAFAGTEENVHLHPADQMSSAIATFGGGSVGLTANGAHISAPKGYSTFASKIYVGTNDWSWNFYGAVAEAVIVSRALTDSEISAIYANHQGWWHIATHPEAATLAFGAAGGAISPYIYGSNEHGTLETSTPTVEFDAAVDVTIRRLGGASQSSYNWTNNCDNSAGDTYRAHGKWMGQRLGLSAADLEVPAAVISKFVSNTEGIGARSIVQVPLIDYVAADANGLLSPGDEAPSPRWSPVIWISTTPASDPVDPSHVDMPHLIRRLVATYGTAAEGGIYGYALDNEPGILNEIAPYTVLSKLSASWLIERSIAVATAIKEIDPTAKIFGPVAWGVPDLIDLTQAPDWGDFSSTYDCFISAYLDAFKAASDADGVRLLDGLDIHLYPNTWGGSLWSSLGPNGNELLLANPRSWDDPDFDEDSWIANTLPRAMSGGLARPFLPALRRLIDAYFPGTKVMVSEWQFGDASNFAAGLATADALGRLAANGVDYACHYGGLRDWTAQAFKLFRDYDGAGGRYGTLAVPVTNTNPRALSAHAALAGERATLILVNKAKAPISITLPEAWAPQAQYGFDAAHPQCGAIPLDVADGVLVLPPRSARLVVLA